MAKEEAFWRQNSREKWLEEGDKNTKYFHNSTLFNRAINNITNVKDTSGSFTDNLDKIVETFVRNFHNIFNNFNSSNLVSQTKCWKLSPN